MNYLCEVLRPKHWVKNSFIFLALIFGKKLFVFPQNLKTLIAFILFSFIASAAYLINDICNLEKDRLHPHKKNRPLASGKMSVSRVAFIALALSIVSVISSFILNINFGFIVLAYLFLNILYSKILREIAIIDLCCIACFFLLRIIAGSFIAGAKLSFWAIFITIIFSLFLGLIKRKQELNLLNERAYLHRKAIAGYRIQYINLAILALSFIIIVFYILYVINFYTVVNFGTKNLLYTVPFVVYGIIRYLNLIYGMHEEGDPIKILFSDINMQLTVIFWIFTCIIVIYL